MSTLVRRNSGIFVSLSSAAVQQIVLCCLTFLILTCAIDTSSLWIDEGFSAFMASQRTFSLLLHNVRLCDASDLQMIGYYVYLWLWTHAFGTSEAVLRASNLPFVALFCASFAAASYWCFKTLLWPVCLLSPFVWTYTNEARVYLPLMACAAASVAACLVACNSTGPRIGRAARLACAFFALITVSLDVLGVLVLPTVLSLIFLSQGKDRLGRWRNTALLAFPGLAIEGAYYAWTLFRPVTMRYDVFHPSYMALFAYEFLGLQGLGPERNRLRLLPYSGAIPADFVVAVVAGCLLTIAIWMLFRAAGPLQRREALRILLVAGGCLGLLFLLGFALKDRFLPRHGSGLYPVFLLFLLSLLPARILSQRRVAACALLILCGIWIASDIRLRVMQKYTRDNYRAAVAEVVKLESAGPADVIWAGDFATASYYGLNIADPFHLTTSSRLNLANTFSDTQWHERATAWYGINMQTDQVQTYLRDHARSKRSLYVVITKPDLYDRANVWRAVIAVQGTKLPLQIGAFVFYRVGPEA